jgi:hypothetical protein
MKNILTIFCFFEEMGKNGKVSPKLAFENG